MARRGGSSVSLPWEGRGAWVKSLVRGPRWKVGVALVLTAVALTMAWRSAEHRARARDTRASIAEVKRAVANFRADLGRCPQSIHELMHPPRSGSRYLRQVPVDGWGRPLRMVCPGRYTPGGADVVSAGPSGSFLIDDNLR